MRIGLDVDGVIADARAETRFRFISEFGEPKWNQVKSFLYTSESPDVPQGWMKAQFEDPTYWLNIQPHQDGWYMANKWFSEGHDVYLITARHTSETIAMTERWLEEWDIIVSDLISCGVLTKHTLIEPLKLDIFVEDNPEEAKNIGSQIPCFLLDAEYNKSQDAGLSLRVKSLYDVNKVVERWQDLGLSAKSVRNSETLRTLIGSTYTERTQKIG